MIHNYFRDYATHFNLWDYITFNTRVERLFRRQDGTWVIETKEGEEEFEFVCVGNGHYEDGWIPDIPGLSYVPLLLCRDYRDSRGSRISNGTEISKEKSYIQSTTSAQPTIYPAQS